MAPRRKSRRKKGHKGVQGKIATGRFKSREELENFVLVQYHLIWRLVPDIAKDAQVSRMTVWRIVGRY